MNEFVKSGLIQHIKQDVGRSFIVGDIHGDYDALMAKLNEVNFDYSIDKCYSVGDVINRGDKSLECFNLLSKSWFKSVRGNHESLCMMYANNFDVIEQKLINRFCNKHGGQWFYDLPSDVRRVISDRFSELPTAIVLQRGDKKYLIVHGDIPRGISTLSDLDESLNSNHRDEISHMIINGRTLIDDIKDESRKFTIPNFVGVDMVFMGHTTMLNTLTYNNYTYLDTACGFEDGYLTMVNV